MSLPVESLLCNIKATAEHATGRLADYSLEDLQQVSLSLSNAYRGVELEIMLRKRQLGHQQKVWP